MRSYVICVDVAPWNTAYKDLFDAIKLYPTWGRLSELSWVVTSDMDAKGVRDHLRRFMRDNDTLVVVRCGGEAAWVNAMADGERLRENMVK